MFFLFQVILLDQFTRNVYRGDAKAFSGDKEARRVAKMCLNRWPEYYSPCEKMFLTLPFSHSELIGDQDLADKYSLEYVEEAKLNEDMDDGKDLYISSYI